MVFLDIILFIQIKNINIKMIHAWPGLKLCIIISPGLNREIITNNLHGERKYTIYDYAQMMKYAMHIYMLKLNFYELLNNKRARQKYQVSANYAFNKSRGFKCKLRFQQK
jgi:hypothetical protein